LFGEKDHQKKAEKACPKLYQQFKSKYGFIPYDVEQHAKTLKVA
jgi:hypothetical protein